jgi:hypothetical protein
MYVSNGGVLARALGVSRPRRGFFRGGAAIDGNFPSLLRVASGAAIAAGSSIRRRG